MEGEAIDPPRSTLETDLVDALRRAARSPRRLVYANQAATRGREGDVSLRLDLEVDRAPGGALAVRLPDDPKGPHPRVDTFLVDPDDPATAEPVLAELRHMFDQWNAKPEGTWTFEATGSGTDDSIPIDEDWRLEPSPAALASRLRRATTGRGGSVAVGLVGATVVVRLAVSLGLRGRRVGARLEPLVGRDPRIPLEQEWQLTAALAMPGEVLRAAVSRLRQAHEAPAGQAQAAAAIRFEANRAATASTRAGCTTVLLLAVIASLAGAAMYFLDWPHTGLIAELHESATNKPGGGFVIVEVVMAIGALLVLLVGRWFDGLVERLRLPYVTDAAISSGVHASLYLAWVALVILTPFGRLLPSLLGGLVFVAMILFLVGSAAVVLRKWIRARRARRTAV